VRRPDDDDEVAERLLLRPLSVMLLLLLGVLLRWPGDNGEVDGSGMGGLQLGGGGGEFHQPVGGRDGGEPNAQVRPRPPRCHSGSSSLLCGDRGGGPPRCVWGMGVPLELLTERRPKLDLTETQYRIWVSSPLEIALHPKYLPEAISVIIHDKN
jgi:hypothetical protein